MDVQRCRGKSAIERVEDMLHFRGRNPGPVIFDRYLQVPRRAPASRYPHPVSRSAVLDRVREQIDDGLLNGRAVAWNIRQTLRDLRPNFDSYSSRRRCGRRNCLTNLTRAIPLRCLVGSAALPRGYPTDASANEDGDDRDDDKQARSGEDGCTDRHRQTLD